MDKLKMRGMESNASNERLRRFLAMVFSIADDRVTNCRKLRPDLVLQSGDQFNSHERSVRKQAFDGIAKFGPGRLWISCRAQLLIHSFTPKIMNKRTYRSIETATHHREILPHRSVGEKLPHQCISIPIGLGKQQNSGGKAINAVHDQRPLPLLFQSGG